MRAWRRRILQVRRWRWPQHRSKLLPSPANRPQFYAIKPPKTEGQLHSKYRFSSQWHSSPWKLMLPPTPLPCSIQYCGSKADCAACHAAWSKCSLHVSPSNRCWLGKQEPLSWFYFVSLEGPKNVPVGGDGVVSDLCWAVDWALKETLPI